MTVLKNKKGPIAESYYELQQIQLLEQAYSNLPKNITNFDRLFLVLLQCTELLYYNAADLCERSQDYMPNRPENLFVIAQHSSWKASILHLATVIGTSLRRIQTKTDLVNNNGVQILPTPAIECFIRIKSKNDCVLSHCIEKHKDPFLDGIENGSITNPIGLLVQRTKQANQFFKINLSQLNFKTPINEIVKNYCSSESLKEAVVNGKLDDDTFFTQFKLLHQIPELLGLEGLNMMEVLKNHLLKMEISKSIPLMYELTQVLEIMLRCLEIILNNLLPYEYHKIRENLGKTSGSHSVTLSQKLFSSSYADLSEAYTNVLHNISDCDKETFSMLELVFSDLRERIYLWRDMHIGFPRNVLGGKGIKSLIGSPDAISATVSMQHTFRSRDKAKDTLLGRENYSNLKDYFVNSENEGLSELLFCFEKLDSQMLELTADITRKNFPEVQNRTGFFSKD